MACDRHLLFLFVNEHKNHTKGEGTRGSKEPTLRHHQKKYHVFNYTDKQMVLDVLQILYRLVEMYICCRGAISLSSTHGYVRHSPVLSQQEGGTPSTQYIKHADTPIRTHLRRIKMCPCERYFNLI